MLDRRLLLEDPDKLVRGLARRGSDVGVVALLDIEASRRELLQKVEEGRSQRNALSKEIGVRKRNKEPADDLFAAVEEVKRSLELWEEELQVKERLFDELWLLVPNLIDDDAPDGPDESGNVEIRRWGVPKSFEYAPKAHYEIGEDLGLLDFEQAAKITGSRFAVLKGDLARLERALGQWMLDLHSDQHGYTEVQVPYMVNRDALTGTGQLPKFEEDLFFLRDNDYALIPTAEVPVTNLHRESIVEEEALPLKYVAWTPCFRREAGSAGRDTRGLIRQHQFHKVELVHLVAPEESETALQQIVDHAAKVLELLELPYRVMALCAGDTGFSSARTFDLEVWLPAQGAYREISSCSNFRDFQARRASIRGRFKNEQSGKRDNRILHTLNGSGLAVGRTLVALLENHQNNDGSVTIPAVLRPYMGGRERIGGPR
ncbi:MAG: serine--tRNA ligase [Alphaproteobacteria bacterium CG_4_10_14_0_2_um_filter_63_37]|nr:MAG: serine--tRNA ligase [Proteobacteria bacterium CG1_02_64_396]PJA24392.1 MAG: serine--tRNA ligase [Alphaproteobacteria bacterium CG_4_10_14_0_2_um_filter_63_37]